MSQSLLPALPFELTRSNWGDGGWSLHPAGFSDDAIADGRAPLLTAGMARCDPDTGEWDRPDGADYAEAWQQLRRILGPYIDILCTHDDGAHGGDAQGAALAWRVAEYSSGAMADWLNVGIAFPHLADRLLAEGYLPGHLTEVFRAWASDETVDEFLAGSLPGEE